MNETHSGNLNHSKMPAKGEEGTTGGKSNSETATLRSGSLPQASAVTQVSVDANKSK